MNDLRTRITEYVDSSVPPVDIDLLVEALNQGEEPARRLRPAPADRKWWQHRRWVPVLAAAVVVLLMVGGAALLRDPSEPPVITAPEQTPTSTTSLPVRPANSRSSTSAGQAPTHRKQGCCSS